MNDPVKNVVKGVGMATAIAGAIKLVFSGERNPETGAIDKVTLFGFVPLYDRARAGRRRARRAARKAEP
jgi:hypothetical protein